MDFMARSTQPSYLKRFEIIVMLCVRWFQSALLTGLWNQCACFYGRTYHVMCGYFQKVFWLLLVLTSGFIVPFSQIRELFKRPSLSPNLVANRHAQSAHVLDTIRTDAVLAKFADRFPLLTISAKTWFRGRGHLGLLYHNNQFDYVNMEKFNLSEMR